MIERNLHPTGRLGNMLFGLAEITDGIVRVLSLGFLHTTLMVDLTRWQAQRMILVSNTNRWSEMNKRIKELAKQAGYYQEQDYDGTWFLAMAEGCWEKFAELVRADER